MAQSVFLVTFIGIWLTGFARAQNYTMVDNSVQQSEEVLIQPMATKPTITDCEGNSNLSFVQEQLIKFKACIPKGVSQNSLLSPFTCKQYKTIANCFHEYTTKVGPCYKAVQKDWLITDKILTDASEYLCDPKDELLHVFYSHGGIKCLSHQPHQCGPNMVNVLLNNTEYSSFSKQLLTHNYTKASCINETANAECVLQRLATYCSSPLPNITLTAERLHHIVLEHAECGSGAVSLMNFNTNLIFVVALAFVTLKLMLSSP